MEGAVPHLRALELFCGIGGFAAAVAGSNVRVVAALDQSEAALSVYRLNYPDHQTRTTDLERVSAWELTSCDADIWWLSPPCQPYCERGCQRDLEDPRSRSLLRLLELFESIPEGRLPRMLALENVAGFTESQARERLMDVLARRGYELRERMLCPTEIGIPSRRPRYYLAASRSSFSRSASFHRQQRPLGDFVSPPGGPVCESLRLSRTVVEKFASGLRIVDPADPAAYTTCFTSGYGKSIVNAGSYLRCGDGVRYFSPEEIARLLAFPPSFRFPDEVSLRKRWHLVGNSLSVAAVREVLTSFPEIRLPVEEALNR